MGPARRQVDPSAAGDGLEARLRIQRDAWERRPAVRALYREWYALIAGELAPSAALTVELGCGIGTFKEVCPGAIATDVELTPWAERVADATALPFADASVANLAMTDVIHHLQRPSALFDEAVRVLEPGGRLLAVEPYCSPVSTLAYRAFHREAVDLRADPLGDSPQTGADPLDANGAVPTLLFWRQVERFRARFPSLRIVRRERLALLAYPLSGGFEGTRLAPDSVVGAAQRLERRLGGLAPVCAFRCFVVLERTEG